MSFRLLFSVACALFSVASSSAQNGSTFTNFIRQVQLPTGVEWDMGVASTGEELSPLSIDPGGARFELWTVQALPLTSYLLDNRYVGTYVPIGQVAIRSEDPYSLIPRTRADRPFYVDISISGLLSGAGVPVASKSLKFLHHVQSYGATGDGIGINRDLATLNSQVSMDQNGTQTLTYVINSIPGANRAKIRGEERFSFFSLADYQAPESQIASQFIQIWPVADGALEGISPNQHIRFSLPTVTITLNDLYPTSHTYAQVYKGAAQLGRVGAIVPGSSLLVNDTVPNSRILVLSDYEGVFDDDGLWTMELVTETPFGIERMAHVSFTLDRTIEMNGNVTTVE
ncbi:MAG: hypothetical protein EAZ84_11600 [Verrucomicrobia bacterium]|nr:MAG: hypothetical protein EAZ84_11600 [Verrucomicrobiota bacterium]TAE88716.1 MAG: hypothetical protein EAZ82_03175 [Verrucomicrobiota bacterium]TAF26518.1 MAG: hypothetical protein EAZ71_04700 [Verrucomicrobiota bacterium]